MKTIIITGASGGIGAATATYFQEEGWNVVGTSRNPSSEWPLDLRSDDACRLLVERIHQRHGRVDALFNNAGFAQLGGFLDFSTNEHREAFEINLFAAMRMTEAVLPQMSAQQNGRIIHMGSVVSHLPAPFMGSYAATKHGLEGFSKSLDHELRGTGVRSVLIRSGFVKSNIAEHTKSGSREVSFLPSGADAVARSIDHALSKADDPRAVVGAIFAACTAPNPKAVIDAGREAKSLSRLRRLLPASVFEAALRKQFGLARV